MMKKTYRQTALILASMLLLPAYGNAMAQAPGEDAPYEGTASYAQGPLLGEEAQARVAAVMEAVGKQLAAAQDKRIRILTGRNETQRKELAEQGKELSGARETIDTLTGEQQELQAKVTEKETQVTELQTKISGQETKLGELQTSYDNLKAEKNTLQDEYDTLQDEYDTLKEDKDTLQGEYDTLEQEKNDLQSSYDNLSSEKDSLQGDYDTMKG